MRDTCVHGISEQDALSKITLDSYMWTGQIEFLRRKHQSCKELTYISFQTKSDVVLKIFIYQSLFEIICHKGEWTLKPFWSLVDLHRLIFSFVLATQIWLVPGRGIISLLFRFTLIFCVQSFRKSPCIVSGEVIPMVNNDKCIVIATCRNIKAYCFSLK